ncbi:GAF domain-containing protein [Streptomyces lanatus]|uniref:GAF domain-containing protein n=1 Tax=Streptomyces lanatus TaxID=66900 RepID=A0ABV1Y0H0_9ACTN|nr:GAF domain-containing protein [Streptomyces lanatus]GHH22154.1 histidine kinase [Streptomyces lanatus]
MTDFDAFRRPALGQRTSAPLLAAPGQDVIVPRPGAVSLGQEVVSAAQARELAERQEREALLQRLGVPTGPDDRMDQFADHIAETTGMLYGFVNIFYAEQTFVGLHNPPPDSGHLILGRTMSLEHGWCPAVVRRKKGLPLWDVHASSTFSGNVVVDMVGIRSYFGVPLIYEGVVLGTACAIDPEARPRSDARRHLDAVKDGGALVLDALTSRAPAR